MQAGYFMPLTLNFKLAWMWWVAFLAFQRVFYYENNLQWSWWLIIWAGLVALYFYFLIRQRRFFASAHHLYFTKDFRVGMINIDLAHIQVIRLNNYRFEFIYAGKQYDYIVLGQSNQLLRKLLKENDVKYTITKTPED